MKLMFNGPARSKFFPSLNLTVRRGQEFTVDSRTGRGLLANYGPSGQITEVTATPRRSGVRRTAATTEE